MPVLTCFLTQLAAALGGRLLGLDGPIVDPWYGSPPRQVVAS